MVTRPKRERRSAPARAASPDPTAPSSKRPRVSTSKRVIKLRVSSASRSSSARPSGDAGSRRSSPPASSKASAQPEVAKPPVDRTGLSPVESLNMRDDEMLGIIRDCLQAYGGDEPGAAGSPSASRLLEGLIEDGFVRVNAVFSDQDAARIASIYSILAERGAMIDRNLKQQQQVIYPMLPPALPNGLAANGPSKGAPHPGTASASSKFALKPRVNNRVAAVQATTAAKAKTHGGPPPELQFQFEMQPQPRAEVEPRSPPDPEAPPQCAAESTPQRGATSLPPSGHFTTVKKPSPVAGGSSPPNPISQSPSVPADYRPGSKIRIKFDWLQ